MYAIWVRTCLQCGSWYCQCLSIRVSIVSAPSFFRFGSGLIIHQRYMNRKAARHIAQSIQRLPYLECLNELQSIALIYDFDVDFDYVYFNDIEIPIAAIFGFEIKDNFLFILTKKQQLYYINLTTKLCDMILLNQSMYDIIITKLKLLFNSKL